MNFKSIYRHHKRCLFWIIIFSFVLLLLHDRKIKNEASMSKYNQILIQTLYKRPIRIFCFIITSPKNFQTRTLAVNQTWATSCDKYFFVTKFVQHELSADMSYEADAPFPILQPAGLQVDVYEKLSDKIFATLRDIYFRYSDYDYYLKADDDTYVFVDNLRRFLETKNSSVPVTYGYDFQYYNEYQSGGAGYVLSNAALKAIGKRLYVEYDFCPNTGTEDVDVANCLRKLGVYQEKSIDEFGRERFHPFDIWFHFHGYYPPWLKKYSKNPLKKGYDCCSDTSISFHYIQPERMMMFHKTWKTLGTRNFTLFIESIIAATNWEKYTNYD